MWTDVGTTRRVIRALSFTFDGAVDSPTVDFKMIGNRVRARLYITL